MKRATSLLAAMVVAVLFATVPVGAQEAQTPDVTPPFDRYTATDVLWVARLCVHEATWAGGEGGTSDCGGIYQVLLNRRSERERIVDTISRITPRFWRGTTTRSWARHLAPGRMRVDPIGWPETWPGIASYHERWRGVYMRTRAFMDGTEPLPCEGDVMHWFGRQTDHEALARRLTSGRWVEAECAGSGENEERNAFLMRAPEPEVALGG